MIISGGGSIFRTNMVKREGGGWGGLTTSIHYLQFQRTQSVDGLFDQVRYLQQFRLIWKCKEIF